MVDKGGSIDRWKAEDRALGGGQRTLQSIEGVVMSWRML